MTPIQNISVPVPITPSLEFASASASGAPATGQASFKEFMLEALDHVNSMQQHADQAVEQLMTGGDVNPAEVLTAVQKADLSFRMMMQIRNKLVQAFQEIKEIRI